MGIKNTDYKLAQCHVIRERSDLLLFRRDKAHLYYFTSRFTTVVNSPMRWETSILGLGRAQLHTRAATETSYLYIDVLWYHRNKTGYIVGIRICKECIRGFEVGIAQAANDQRNSHILSEVEKSIALFDQHWKLH